VGRVVLILDRNALVLEVFIEDIGIDPVLDIAGIRLLLRRLSLAALLGQHLSFVLLAFLGSLTKHLLLAQFLPSLDGFSLGTKSVFEVAHSLQLNVPVQLFRLEAFQLLDSPLFLLLFEEGGFLLLREVQLTVENLLRELSLFVSDLFLHLPHRTRVSEVDGVFVQLLLDLSVGDLVLIHFLLEVGFVLHHFHNLLFLSLAELVEVDVLKPQAGDVVFLPPLISKDAASFALDFILFPSALFFLTELPLLERFSTRLALLFLLASELLVIASHDLFMVLALLLLASEHLDLLRVDLALLFFELGLGLLEELLCQVFKLAFEPVVGVWHRLAFSLSFLFAPLLLL